MIRKILFLPTLLLVFIWFFFFRPLFLGGPASYIIISGPSMKPTLNSGDLAVLQRKTTYTQGKVIAFRVNNNIVIHRIVGGSVEAGYITQGDNKDDTDPWQPLPDQILGEMWFSVAGAGRPLNILRQPKNLIALGGLLTLMFLDDSNGHKIRRRGKRMKAMLKNNSSSLLASGWAMNLLVASLVFTLLLGAVAVYGFIQPLEQTESVERLSYEHTAAFQYTVHTEPSILNPQGVIGPVGPASSPVINPAETSPVFTRLARTIDIDISYLLKSNLPVDLKGELSVVLQIKAGEGWSKTDPLLAPVPFDGPSASAHVSVDIPQIMAVIKTVGEQTGFTPGTYEAAIIPIVRLVGRIGEQSIDDIYAPAFNIKLDPTRINLDPELARSETKNVEEQVQRPGQIQLPGISIPVIVLRLLGVIGAVIGLLVACLLAALIFLGAGLDEAARLQARYGSLIISVSASSLGPVQKVEVASMQDLVRLAQRDGCVICHQTLRGGTHLYFIPEGQVVYTYFVGKPGVGS